MDTVYLKRNVGDCLAECLSEVAEKRPADPIEYIAKWLYKYIENREYKRKVKRQMREIAEQKNELAQKLENQQKCQDEESKIKAEDEERKKAELDATNTGTRILAKIVETVEPQEVLPTPPSHDRDNKSSTYPGREIEVVAEDIPNESIAGIENDEVYAAKGDVVEDAGEDNHSDKGDSEDEEDEGV